MAVEVGQTWTRKKINYTVKRVDHKGLFSYVWALPEGLEDTTSNCICYGSKLFKEEFNLMKGGDDGTS